MEGDSKYFGRRANEERTAAIASPHPQVRKVHLEFAARYQDLAAAITSRDELLSNYLGERGERA